MRRIFLILLVGILLIHISFSNTILVYPKSIEVVRGENVTFDVFVAGEGECSVYTNGRYLSNPKSVTIPNGGAAKFTVTYISTEPSIGEKKLALHATKSNPVYINLKILPNEADKKVINETYWKYVEEVNRIRDVILHDKNATANGMVGLTNIVIEKLWVAYGDIEAGKYYEAQKVMDDAKPQIEMLEEYVGKESSGGYKKYIIIILVISILVIIVIIFELLKHYFTNKKLSIDWDIIWKRPRSSAWIEHLPPKEVI